MNSICTECHYIGEAKQGPIHTYKFPLAGLFIAICISSLDPLFTMELSKNYFYINLAIAILSFILGIYLLISDHQSSKLNTKTQRTKPSLTFLLLGIFLIIWGLLTIAGFAHLAGGYFKADWTLGDFLFVLTFLFFGVLTLHFYFTNSTICPSCEKKKTMIAIDNPMAKDIIQQNKLSVPE